MSSCYAVRNASSDPGISACAARGGAADIPGAPRADQLNRSWKMVFGLERLRGRRSSWADVSSCPHGIHAAAVGARVAARIAIALPARAQNELVGRAVDAGDHDAVVLPRPGRRPSCPGGAARCRRPSCCRDRGWRSARPPPAPWPRHDAAGEAQDGDALERRLLDLPLEQLGLAVAGHLQRNAQPAELVADGKVARCPAVRRASYRCRRPAISRSSALAVSAASRCRPSAASFRRGCSATAFL